MIRRAVEADREVVVTMMVRYVARTPYGRILWAVREDAHKLFTASLTSAFTLVDETPLGLAGAIVLVQHLWMGAQLIEEVGFWHDSPRGVVRLAEAAEAEALQNCAEVLKMSAPLWTALDHYYRRRQFEALETVWVKVLHGPAFTDRVSGAGRGTPRRQVGEPHVAGGEGQARRDRGGAGSADGRLPGGAGSGRGRGEAEAADAAPLDGPVHRRRPAGGRGVGDPPA